MAKVKPKPQRIKGWAGVAKFLGQTPSVAQRWHHKGMPVTIEGRPPMISLLEAPSPSPPWSCEIMKLAAELRQNL